jgi:hypothetical protein
MSMATNPLTLLAILGLDPGKDGVSLNRWIATMVAQKIGAVETSVEPIPNRAGDARSEKLKVLLVGAPERGTRPRSARGGDRARIIAFPELLPVPDSF